MQSIELQELLLIDTHEVSHSNWGTLNAILHMVLKPLKCSDTG